MSLTEYGAILTSLKVPDREGRLENVTLGHRTFEDWLDNPAFFGATVGRFGNRIAGGRFSIEGKEYELATNNDPGGIPCHLHGGLRGFNKVIWKGRPEQRPGAVGVCFTHYSDDGEEGYPGNLTAEVTYWLTENNELIFDVKATTDAPTPVNIINHTYWNLGGKSAGNILSHELQLHASQYLPTNRGLIPTGERAMVEGTPMDFRTPVEVGKRIDDDFEALKFGEGYDHCWILEEGEGDEVRPAAVLHDPKSGRVMEVLTNHPGLQFYSGNFLPDRRAGLCLETEGFPDAPNQPGFPDSILKPGEIYSRSTIHRFSTK